jgi:hypothetical protein
VRFCIRDDDTCFFTTPDDLERAYGEIMKTGPISLAIIPFCRAGSNRAVPEKLRGRWSVHPLHENRALVSWLRARISAGRFEPMLHGYHHDDREAKTEFVNGTDLARKVSHGRRYLEDLLGAPVRVFVPPHNAIGRRGLKAIAREGLHLGGVAGLCSGWSWLSPASLKTWRKLRKWRASGNVGIPWALDLTDHKELAGNPVTPLSRFRESLRRFDEANRVDGVFCAATHYWEFDHPTEDPDCRTVGDHLRKLIQQALLNPKVQWVSVGSALEKFK